MAVFHISSYNSGTSRKYPVFCIGIEFYNFIFINKRQIYRHMFVNQIYLIQCQFPLFYIKNFIFLFCFISHIIFGKQACQIIHKSCLILIPLKNFSVFGNLRFFFYFRIKSLRLIYQTVAYLVISFFLILAIGSMVARTTFVGAVVGVVIYILHSPLFTGSLKRSRGKVALIFTSITALAVGVFIYLYNTDPYYYHLLRFAFEGFFNFVERGEFTTSSTEVLQTMWKWPTDTQGWIIGTGIYGQFSQGTDIGYCRLILYSGLIGFVTFALSFVFYAYVLGKKYYPYRWMFLGFLAMTFIVWVKVSSDILMIYTFMFWLRPEDDALILQQAKA